MPFYGGSDTNFIRNADWFGNGHQVLLTAEDGCMFMRLNCAYTVVQVTQASIEVVEIVKLPWVGVACKQFYYRQRSLKVFGKARLAGLLWVKQPHIQVIHQTSLVPRPLSEKYSERDLGRSLGLMSSLKVKQLVTNV